MLTDQQKVDETKLQYMKREMRNVVLKGTGVLLGFQRKQRYLTASERTFVTNIAKCFVFDVFPLNSVTAQRRMFESGKVQEGLLSICIHLFAALSLSLW